MGIVKKYLMMLLGIASLAFGAALMIQSNLGTDGFNVFNVAVSGKVGLMPGTINIIIGTIFLIYLFIFKSQYRTLGTFLTTFCLGTIVNVFIIVLEPFNIEAWDMILRIISSIIGCNFIALGIALGVCSTAGLHPNDIIPLVIAERLNKSYKLTRICYDLMYTALGFILGGPVGLGTVLSIILLGPVSNRYMLAINKRIGRSKNA